MGFRAFVSRALLFRFIRARVKVVAGLGLGLAARFAGIVQLVVRLQRDLAVAVVVRWVIAAFGRIRGIGRRQEMPSPISSSGSLARLLTTSSVSSLISRTP